MLRVLAANWFSIDPAPALVHTGAQRPYTAAPAGLDAVQSARERHRFELWPVLNLRWCSATGTRAPGGDAPLLDDPAHRARLVQAVMTAAEHWHTAAGCEGVTLDMEGMWAGYGVDGRADSQQRSTTALVRALAGELHARDLRLAVYSPRRTSADDHKVSYTARCYDHRALAGCADLLLISGYNEHGPGPGPGPITTSAGFRALCAYGASLSKDAVVPLAGAFGYDWPPGQPTQAVGGVRYQSPRALAALAAAHHVTPRCADGEENFSYGQGHEVFYESAAGLAARVRCAAQRGLRWWGLWSADRAPEEFWKLIA